MQGRGGGEVRNFFCSFSRFFRNCFLLVPLARLLVPCVSPVQSCCTLRLPEVWLRHHKFSAIFSQLDLATATPPPPRP